MRNEQMHMQELKEIVNIRNQPCILTTHTKSVHCYRKIKGRTKHTIIHDSY